MTKTLASSNEIWYLKQGRPSPGDSPGYSDSPGTTWKEEAYTREEIQTVTEGLLYCQFLNDLQLFSSFR